MIMTYVTGFMTALILPTRFCINVRLSRLSSNLLFSSSSLWNARITLAPARFSLVMPSTLSRRSCTLRYIGMLTAITPNTTRDSNGIVTTKIIADLKSMVNAITIAPNTIKGERRNRRSTMLTPDWAWLMSLVSRVISVAVPALSISEKENVWIWANSSCRTRLPNPTAAFAAKYWAVTEHKSPISPKATMTRHIRRM